MQRGWRDGETDSHLYILQLMGRQTIFSIPLTTDHGMDLTTSTSNRGFSFALPWEVGVCALRPFACLRTGRDDVLALLGQTCRRVKLNSMMISISIFLDRVRRSMLLDASDEQQHPLDYYELPKDECVNAASSPHLLSNTWSGHVAPRFRSWVTVGFARFVS